MSDKGAEEFKGYEFTHEEINKVMMDRIFPNITSRYIDKVPSQEEDVECKNCSKNTIGHVHTSLGGPYCRSCLHELISKWDMDEDSRDKKCFCCGEPLYPEHECYGPKSIRRYE